MIRGVRGTESDLGLSGSSEVAGDGLVAAGGRRLFGTARAPEASGHQSIEVK